MAERLEHFCEESAWNAACSMGGMQREDTPPSTRGRSAGSQAIESLFSQDLEVDVTEHSQANFYASLEDKQPRGVFVATWLTPAIGSKVRVTLTLADIEEFEFEGTVEWTRDTLRSTTWPGVGVRFPAIPSDVRAAVRRFAEQRGPLLFEA